MKHSPNRVGVNVGFNKKKFKKILRKCIYDLIISKTGI